MTDILIMDDEVDLGEFVSQAIESSGLQCTAFSNAAAFLQALAPNTGLILLDLLMPDIDGVELLRLLAQRQCRARIVLMSGIGARVIETAAELAASLGLTVIGHLQKPFRLVQLQQILTAYKQSQATRVADPLAPLVFPDEDLDRAIERNEFVLHFQPQIDLTTNRVTGMEALVRWQHPELGLIRPDNFIPRAEQLHRIDDLGWCVFRLGLAVLQQWVNSEVPIPVLSVNVSTHSLRDLTFPDTLHALLLQHDVRPEQIILEITETGLLDDLSNTLDVLTRLRMKGIVLSIDDFGTGYAMMQQLRRIPATELKIDRSFVDRMLVNVSDRIMVQKTIEMGHELGMKVVAEGVETPEQLEFLRASRCDVAQGFFFSRPLPVDDLSRWLGQYNLAQRHGSPQPAASMAN